MVSFRPKKQHSAIPSHCKEQHQQGFKYIPPLITPLLLPIPPMLASICVAKPHTTNITFLSRNDIPISTSILNSKSGDCQPTTAKSSPSFLNSHLSTSILNTKSGYIVDPLHLLPPKTKQTLTN